MADNEKVKVTSMTNGITIVNSPNLMFHRVWQSKGSSVMIERSKLEELMYDTGFEYMIRTGMLYIEDLQVKKDLGLEPEDATAPVNIIVLSDADKRRFLVAMPLNEFKIQVAKLNREQLNSLIDFAVNNRLGDLEKSRVLKEMTGRDILRTIELKDLSKEG